MVVEEDMRKLNITEDMTEDRKQCTVGNSYHTKPQKWETRDVKKR